MSPGSRWTSFTADPRRPRILHETGNPDHRLRVEHDAERLYIELSGEDGAAPWTVIAIHRESRRWVLAHAETKTAATKDAARRLDSVLDASDDASDDPSDDASDDVADVVTDQ